MRFRLVPIACVLMLASCANKFETREAVEKGLRKDLAQRGLNADAMDISFNNVAFNDGKAEATVAFAPKGGLISQGLTMKYNLELRDNEWVIVGRSNMNVQQHTGGMTPQSASPQASPSMGGSPIPGMADPQPLPPGHPGVTSAPQSGSPK